MARLHVAIAVADAAVARLPDILAECHRRGLLLEWTLSSVGVATGSIDAEHIEELRGIPGIATIEAEDVPSTTSGARRH